MKFKKLEFENARSISDANRKAEAKLNAGYTFVDSYMNGSCICQVWGKLS